MWFFKRKPAVNTEAVEMKADKGKEACSDVNFEPSVLRQNNITRLSIDERWTKLFVTVKMNNDIELAEKEMNELIKKEAMLKNEQENLEPKKRKCMNDIMNLTKEAFENDNGDAKDKLKECKKEIEKINSRINNVFEDIEKIEEELKTANLKLLEGSLAYIFSTLRSNMDRANDIKAELAAIEEKKISLNEELETISVDWTKYATDLTELIGTDQVKRLESDFGLEGLKDETSDTTTDKGN